MVKRDTNKPFVPIVQLSVPGSQHERKLSPTSKFRLKLTIKARPGKYLITLEFEYDENQKGFANVRNTFDLGRCQLQNFLLKSTQKFFNRCVAKDSVTSCEQSGLA